MPRATSTDYGYNRMGAVRPTTEAGFKMATGAARRENTGQTSQVTAADEEERRRRLAMGGLDRTGVSLAATGPAATDGSAATGGSAGGGLGGASWGQVGRTDGATARGFAPTVSPSFQSWQGGGGGGIVGGTGARGPGLADTTKLGGGGGKPGPGPRVEGQVRPEPGIGGGGGGLPGPGIDTRGLPTINPPVSDVPRGTTPPSRPPPAPLGPSWPQPAPTIPPGPSLAPPAWSGPQGAWDVLQRRQAFRDGAGRTVAAGAPMLGYEAERQRAAAARAPYMPPTAPTAAPWSWGGLAQQPPGAGQYSFQVGGGMPGKDAGTVPSELGRRPPPGGNIPPNYERREQYSTDARGEPQRVETDPSGRPLGDPYQEAAEAQRVETDASGRAYRDPGTAYTPPIGSDEWTRIAAGGSSMPGLGPNAPATVSAKPPPTPPQADPDIMGGGTWGRETGFQATPGHGDILYSGSPTAGFGSGYESQGGRPDTGFPAARPPAPPAPGTWRAPGGMAPSGPGVPSAADLAQAGQANIGTGATRYGFGGGGGAAPSGGGTFDVGGTTGGVGAPGRPGGGGGTFDVGGFAGGTAGPGRPGGIQPAGRGANAFGLSGPGMIPPPRMYGGEPPAGARTMEQPAAPQELTPEQPRAIEAPPTETRQQASTAAPGTGDVDAYGNPITNVVRDAAGNITSYTDIDGVQRQGPPPYRPGESPEEQSRKSQEMERDYWENFVRKVGANVTPGERRAYAARYLKDKYGMTTEEALAWVDAGAGGWRDYNESTERGEPLDSTLARLMRSIGGKYNSGNTAMEDAKQYLLNQGATSEEAQAYLTSLNDRMNLGEIDPRTGAAYPAKGQEGAPVPTTPPRMSPESQTLYDKLEGLLGGDIEGKIRRAGKLGLAEQTGQAMRAMTERGIRAGIGTEARQGGMAQVARGAQITGAGIEADAAVQGLQRQMAILQQQASLVENDPNKRAMLQEALMRVQAQLNEAQATRDFERRRQETGEDRMYAARMQPSGPKWWETALGVVAPAAGQFLGGLGGSLGAGLGAGAAQGLVPRTRRYTSPYGSTRWAED